MTAIFGNVWAQIKQMRVILKHLVVVYKLTSQIDVLIVATVIVFNPLIAISYTEMSKGNE